jgi:hypothetical protein
LVTFFCISKSLHIWFFTSKTLNLITHEVQNYQPVGSEQLRDKNGHQF